MNRKIYLLILLVSVSFSGAWAQAQFGELQGKVTDAKTGEEIIGANLVIKQGDNQKGGASTGIDGSYRIKPIDPGKYDLVVSYIGYNTKIIQGINIPGGSITFVDVKVDEKTLEKEIIEVVAYKKPLFDQGETAIKRTLSEEEIKKAPTRSINELASLSSGVYSEGGTPIIKGNRPDGTIYFIDGVRVRGLQGLPQDAIQQMDVITGGVPAQYGDATGGVISITTRGPSSVFAGGFEAITSQFLEPYGYNLFEGNLSGPLWVKGKGTENAQSKLGFLLAGNVSFQKDPDPSAIPNWVVKDEVLEEIKDKPILVNPAAGGFLPAAQFISKEDMEQVSIRPNTSRWGFNVNGKLDYVLTNNANTRINLTGGGQVGHNNYTSYNYASSLFNYENYPDITFNTYRGYMRFTQHFKNPEEKDKNSTGLKITDAYYSLQVDYTKQYNYAQDPVHQDNFFDYGYYGKYELYKAPFYLKDEDSLGGSYENAYFLRAYSDTLVEFTQADINTTAGNYTRQFFELVDGNVFNYDQIRANGALLNGDRPQIVNNLWTNVGYSLTSYQKFEQDQFRMSASGSFNLNNHAIKIGVQYEQLTERSYNLGGGFGTNGIWSLMRQYANNHILQLDTENPIPIYDENGNFLDTVFYQRLVEDNQTSFDKNFRQYLIDKGAKDVYGNPIDERSFINIDRYSPEDFKLSYFSADELLRTGFVNYHGYDYLGNKVTSKPGLDDFLNNEEERLIAPFNPIYMAGYIEDQFAFRDLIFRIGVRVDRFDANQPVLKDKYSLYPTRKVGEVDAGELHPAGQHPGNIGDNYVVYVDDELEPTKIVGYRDGDRWYDAKGAVVADPNVIALATGSGTISPYLVAETEEEKVITKESFEDYEPQINVMPRIAFSFPITDEAKFFANYDILTQRPSSGLNATIDNFFYLQQRATQVIPNPALEPERRTNYELGFKQRISTNSALSITAFYGEIRNMIQLVQINQAYPITYTTYRNIDFGTVKGLTMSYDLRKTPKSNLSLQTNYTLQYAEGTGSNAVDQFSLINAGLPNLRTPFPLDFDIRHNIVASLDYRYGSGRDYNGPRTESGKEIFKNTGLNLIFKARSGRPYSQQSNVTQAVGIGIRQQSTLEGSVNGARLPWSFNFDLRIDRDFVLQKKKNDGEASSGTMVPRRPMYLNVYFWVQNLFDARNVRGVYRYTGNPDDDGFLSSTEGSQIIESQFDQQAYIDQYSIKVNNPNNYAAPRLLRIGARFNF